MDAVLDLTYRHKETFRGIIERFQNTRAAVLRVVPGGDFRSCRQAVGVIVERSERDALAVLGLQRDAAGLHFKHDSLDFASLTLDGLRWTSSGQSATR